MIDTKEYLLDALVESKDASTRAYAAYRGRGLDKLVNVPAPEVRAAVARWTPSVATRMELERLADRQEGLF